MATTHRCAAEGCRRFVPLAMLMCKPHWGMVPRAQQREVWRTYRPGQEGDDKPLTGEYLAAVRDAVAAVAKAEGQAAQ